MKPIYVVTWRYSDGSAHGIVRAFTEQKEADDLAYLIQEHNDCARQIKVETVLFKDEQS